MAGVAQLKAMVGMDTKAYKAGTSQIKSSNAALKESFKQIGTALAGAFSIGMITRATKDLINFSSEIRHTSDNLNVSTESLQALNAMALKYGLSVQDMTKLLGKLRQSQGQVAQGDSTYIDALKALNIQQNEFINADSDRALEMIAKAYVKAGRSAEAYAAVVDLTGRSGKKATAFLEELAKTDMDSVIEDMKKLGFVIEDDVITKLELVGTRMDQVKTLSRVAFAEMLSGVNDIGRAYGVWLQAAVQGRDALEVAGEIGQTEKVKANIEKLKDLQDEMLKQKSTEAAIEKQIADLQKKKTEKEKSVKVKSLGVDLSSTEKMGASFGGPLENLKFLYMQSRDDEKQIAEAQLTATESINTKIDELKNQLEAMRNNVK